MFSIAFSFSNARLQNNYPASEVGKLSDLRALVDLLTSITFFRMKVQELSTPPRASQVVKECLRACMQSTYQFLMDHCADIYARQRGGGGGAGGGELGASGTADAPQPGAHTQPSPSQAQAADKPLMSPDDGGPSSKSLDFWHKFIALLISVIEEDRTSYQPVFSQYALHLIPSKTYARLPIFST